MKQACLIVFFAFQIFSIRAQSFGNEWYNPQHLYLKIPVTKDGVYRINFATLNQGLSNVGVNISTINPEKMQLYGFGQETRLWIEGQSDQKFDSTDFILFYAEGNDGRLDTGLYVNPSYQLNPYYSLYNDTAWYFLSWESSANGQRFTKSESVQFGARTNQDFFMVQKHNSLNYSYNEGERDFAGVSHPLYIEGEGWIGSTIQGTTVRNIPLYPQNFSTLAQAPDAKVNTVTVGTSNAAGVPNHGLYIEYGTSRTLAVDTSYTGYKMIEHQFEVPKSSLSSTFYIYYRKKPLNPEPPSDYQANCYAEIEYAHALALNNESELLFQANADSDTTLYDFSGAATGFYPYVFDLENGVLCKAQQAGSQYRFLIPPGNARPVFLTRQINTVNSLLPSYSSEQGSGKITDYSTLNADSAFVIVTHASLKAAADQYANYRRSKGMNAVVVDVHDLYEAFTYGVKYHPLAIRNFLNYLKSKPNNTPSYLFLMGKSIKEYYTRKNNTHQQKNLVPTIGIPPADNLFTAPLDNQSFIPTIPVGRLAATNPQEVLDYLDKVMDLESENSLNSPNLEDKQWTKLGLHFAGGNDVNQQRIFLGYLSIYESLWEDTAQGGFIKTFKRFSGGSTQDLKFDSVKFFIDRGVSLLSFFGHGSGGQLGINIGEPSDYNNTGKYPIFLANSCNVGDYHLPNTNQVTINENWVLYPKGGSIGFIATTSAGYSSPLNSWSTEFYAQLSKNNYGKSIGQCMQQTVTQIDGLGQLINKTCLEMNLHGDPAIKLYPKEKPDFAIRKEDVKLPEFVSVDQRTLDLNYTVFNLGKGTDTLVPVAITRIFPSGKDTVYNDTLRGIAFSKSGQLSFFISDDQHVGENKFRITVDPQNSIDEIYPVVNNSTPFISVNVTSDDLIPVHPGNYSVQPSTNLSLSASTADPKAPQNTYQFEIDQSDGFNTSAKKSGTVSSAGGVVQWNPQLGAVADSTVFYWRVSPIPKDGSAPKWREYSFQYIPNKTGWSQYEFDQFKTNSFENLIYNKAGQQFEFSDGKVNISANNQGNPQTNEEYLSIRWSINGDLQGRASVCRGARSIMISVIDPRTFKSWETRWNDNGTIKNPNHHFKNYNDYANGTCPVPDRKFQFWVRDSVAMDSMIYMLNQAVPDSFYLLIMSGRNALFQDTSYWKDRHYRVFEDLGADSIRYLNNDVPYILFAQKGNKNKAQEVIGSHSRAAINISVFVETNLNSGSMQSRNVTPSAQHSSLHWYFTGNNSEDSITLELVGEDLQGNENTILTLEKGEYSVPNLQQTVPQINNYRNLHLRGNFRDSLSDVPPQLKYWMVLGEEGLELAIDPQLASEIYKDTLIQGEDLSLKLGVRNLSSTAMKRDLFTRFSLLPNDGGKAEVLYRKYPALKAKESSQIFFKTNTQSLNGSYVLLVDINPEDSLWEPELEHFNNVIAYSFYVIEDKTNPLLDVTFDGVRIMDGDIVSAKPQILVSLNDENEFKLIQDTSAFEIYLTNPSGATQRIYFQNNSSDYTLEFEPAKDRKNVAKVHFNPELKQDGIYELRIKAKDASDNESGKYDYAVNFEVINKSTITQILNYPNPFSTSTQFVFTLTGSVVPDYFRIQILTATGKVVREIDRDELGPIRVGKNITDYAWDGRDEFGDQLANGVYFYRVITKINGEEIEHRNTAADSYFKKGFGKMYLMR